MTGDPHPGREPTDRSTARRVLHLISSDERRGAQVFASQLVAELGGPPDHTLVAIRASSSPGALEVDALGRRRTDPAGFVRLCRRARHHGLILAHGSSALLHGAAAAAVTGRPFVYRNIGDPSAWGDVRGAGVRIGMPLRRAAAVAALYEGARDHLVERYGLDPDRVRTIPNGVPPIPPPDRARRDVARERFGLDPSSTWVGTLGALTEEKRVDAAIEAVAGDARLGLLVVGDGPEAPSLVRLARERAPGRVVFSGSVPDPQDALAAMDVLLLTSRTEGIPAAVIEAGLCGLPAVATRVGGVAEVVDDHRTGVLVDDVAPATLLAALDEALRHGAELGDAARRRCEERFTIRSVAAQWAALLDDVLGGAQREGRASST